MANLIVVLILCIMVVSAGYYIYRAKKRGQKCIGCPYSGSCGGHGRSNNRNTGCCSTSRPEDR